MERSDKRNGKSAVIKIILLLIALVLFLLSFSSFVAKGESCTAHIVIEQTTNRILYKYNAFKKMYPASTTKILTAITVLENCDTERIVQIPACAVGVEGSSIYLKEGERYKITDLLYGMMLRSGNDAATALAHIVGGSTKEFVKMMNSTAKKIGATSSLFKNPHGLHDDEHFTTAYDLALITAYALSNDFFAAIVSAASYEFTKEDGSKGVFYNKNKMLGSFVGANGVKTGFTKRSGRCLVSSARRDNMQLISVVLNESAMWDKSKQLLSDAFDNYSMRKVLGRGEIYRDTHNGELLSGSVLRSSFYPLTEDERKRIRYETCFFSENRGKCIGEIKAYLDNYLLFSQELYTISLENSGGLYEN